MTFDQQEPSANSPCTKTTFFVFGGVWALATRWSRGRAALTAAAPINVRRFMTVSDLARAILRRSATGKPKTTIADDMREEQRRRAMGDQHLAQTPGRIASLTKAAETTANCEGALEAAISFLVLSNFCTSNGLDSPIRMPNSRFQGSSQCAQI